MPHRRARRSAGPGPSPRGPVTSSGSARRRRRCAGRTATSPGSSSPRAGGRGCSRHLDVVVAVAEVLRVGVHEPDLGAGGLELGEHVLERPCRTAGRRRRGQE